MQGRRTGGSSGQPDGQNNQMEDYSENGNEEIEGDPNMVPLDDGLGEDDEDSDGRLLNRQTDNMADLPNDMMAMEDDGDASLDQFQEQLKNIEEQQQYQE